MFVDNSRMPETDIAKFTELKHPGDGTLEVFTPFKCLQASTIQRVAFRIASKVQSN